MARSAVERSNLLCPNSGRGRGVAASRDCGGETRRGAGPWFGSRVALCPGAVCGARVATTGRLRLASGGRTPRFAEGTKLAGAVATLGPS